MRTHTLLITLLASTISAGSGCVQTECGEGTIERDGMCEPANNGFERPVCGPFTHLEGDRCVPDNKPTVCDPATSEPQIDPTTGIITCIGTSSGAACPTPAGATKLTICGQIYDFETMTKFGTDGNCERCDAAAPTTSGPCALTILAFDALQYGMNQSTGAIAISPNDLYIDACGRYRVSNIETNGTGPFIGLGFTEAGKAPQRPLNQLTVTATTGVATSKPSSRVVDKFEAYIVKPSTIMAWEASGGPPLSNGIYAALFRKHKVGNGDQMLPQSGATITKSGNTIPAQDYYFPAAQTMNMSIDTSATATGANGTALVTGTSVNDSVVYAGNGGLGANCRWEPHAAANLANIVFFQIFRKADVPLNPNPCAD